MTLDEYFGQSQELRELRSFIDTNSKVFVDTDTNRASLTRVNLIAIRQFLLDAKIKQLEATSGEGSDAD